MPLIYDGIYDGGVGELFDGFYLNPGESQGKRKMELNITKKQDNPLLSRVEIELKADFLNEPTPKKESIRRMVSSMEKTDEKLVVVKGIHCSFGSGKAAVLAYIYKSEDELKKIEPKDKKESKKAKEPPKA